MMMIMYDGQCMVDAGGWMVKYGHCIMYASERWRVMVCALCMMMDDG